MPEGYQWRRAKVRLGSKADTEPLSAMGGKRTLDRTIGQLVFELHDQCFDRLRRSVRGVLGSVCEKVCPVTKGVCMNRMAP